MDPTTVKKWAGAKPGNDNSPKVPLYTVKTHDGKVLKKGLPMTDAMRFAKQHATEHKCIVEVFNKSGEMVEQVE